MAILRQYACMVVNLVTVYSYGFLFYCTTVVTDAYRWLDQPRLTLRFSLALTIGES